MNLPLVGFDCFPAPYVRPIKQEVVFSCSSDSVFHKILTVGFILSSIAMVACGIVAAFLCQTFVPSLGLFVIGLLCFILACCQYAKIWVRVQPLNLSANQPYSVSKISKGDYLTLLRQWRYLAYGTYYHPGNTQVRILESHPFALRMLMNMPSFSSESIGVIQERDIEAIQSGSLEEAITRYQNTFPVDQETEAKAREKIKASDFSSICRVSLLENKQAFFRHLFYTPIPKREEGEVDLDVLAKYREGYKLSLSSAIDYLTKVKSNKNITLFVAPLGVDVNLSCQQKHSIKLLSKMAFLQAAEHIAFSYKSRKGPQINIVLVDDDTRASLRTIENERIIFSEETSSSNV